ncbi:hypothetical protein PIB30_018240 [Stylosanthes scabra]|uniref:Uncharacterized protein n=1 Tax=Stylosanthes scabra TaxID=79078 RepID=A0ABU6V7R7_9FABA|nr:hypothetical protein [Stylosanthes scabra]
MSSIEVEMQQRAVEYFASSRKVKPLWTSWLKCLNSLNDSLQMKKAEDTEVDMAEQSAIKLRAQQRSQTSNTFVVQDQRPANGTPPLPVGQLGLVKMPSIHVMWMIIQQIQDYHRKMGALATVNSQPPPANILSDLLDPLAIEGSPSSSVHPQSTTISELEGTTIEATAIVPAGVQIGVKAEWRAHHARMVLFLGNKNTVSLVSVQAIMLPPTHLKMELSLLPETIPPRAQSNAHLKSLISVRAEMLLFLTSPTSLETIWSTSNFTFQLF